MDEHTWIVGTLKDIADYARINECLEIAGIMEKTANTVDVIIDARSATKLNARREAMSLTTQSAEIIEIKEFWSTT